MTEFGLLCDQLMSDVNLSRDLTEKFKERDRERAEGSLDSE